MQTYARELLAELPGAWPDAHFAAVVANDGARELPDTVEPLRRTLRVDHGLVRRLVSLRAVPESSDLVHALDTDLPHRSPGATVATVHDLALFDAPWAFPRLNGRVKRSLVRHAVARADSVIAVSSFTAERVKARFERDAIVVHEAPARGCTIAGETAIDAVRARYSLPEQFVLHLGNLEPRKDVPVLAAACRTAGLPLVLAGGAIRTVDVPVGARGIGYVPSAELPALYGAATIVAYISRYEGFALPPVEAMACGAAVVATRVGALGDIALGGIAFVPIGDADAIAATLHDLAHDAARRAELRAAAAEAVSALSWKRAAEETVAVYKNLL